MDKYQALWDNVKNDLERTYDSFTYNEVFYGLDNIYKFQNGYIYILVDLEFRKNRIYSTCFRKICRKDYE